MSGLASHYSGGLRYMSGRYKVTMGAGFPACCSGDRAYRIRNLGNQTTDRAGVTCKACLRNIAREEPTT